MASTIVRKEKLFDNNKVTKSIWYSCGRKTVTVYIGQKLLSIANYVKIKNVLYRDGRQEGYHPNGRLDYVQYYKSGNKHGRQERFRDDGSLFYIEYWLNDLLDGRQEYFWSSGEHKKLAYYKRGKLDGDYHEFDKDGNPTVCRQYQNGEELISQDDLYDNE